MSGTYSINPDGTGTITLKAASAQSSDLTLAFVVTDGGSGLLLIRTEAGTGSAAAVARQGWLHLSLATLIKTR